MEDAVSAKKLATENFDPHTNATGSNSASLYCYLLGWFAYRGLFQTNTADVHPALVRELAAAFDDWIAPMAEPITGDAKRIDKAFSSVNE